MKEVGKHLRNQWMGALALFMVLTGGTAWAATNLTKNSVRSGHIVNGQVKTPDLKGGAVGAGKLAPGIRSYIVELKQTNDAQEDAIGELEDTVAAQQDLLAGVSRETVDGNDTLRFSDMNVQVVNGTDGTAGTPNGLGNLIVGYNVEPSGGADRDGSHYLVVGDRHEWSAFGGILGGSGNTASGDWASVTGGFGNTASGNWASVAGGYKNVASGTDTSVLGGRENTAAGNQSSAVGGHENTASANWASVSGGYNNTANGADSSVLGGRNNTADGPQSSVSGGTGNDAEGDVSSVLGGGTNTASGQAASIAGGEFNTADGLSSSILGGLFETVTGGHGECHPGC